MRGTVAAHEARPVEREHDRKVLDADVVDELIVAALQKCRVDREHGLQPLAGQPRGESDRVLLRDAHVEIPVGKFLREAHQPRALPHRGGDCDETRIEPRHVAQPLAEHLRVGRLAAARLLDALGGIELARSVIEHRIGLGELVALTFLGVHVQELRALQLLDVLQRRDERVEIVAVDRADVVEPEFLEQGRGHDQALGVLLHLFRQIPQRRHAGEDFFACFPRRGIETPGHEPREIAVQRAHRGGNRHVVVVQDHEQVGIHHAGVVEGLESHACRHGAVADHRHDVALLLAGIAFQLRALRHAERRAHRGARMGGAESVVLALAAPREARDAPAHAYAAHRFTAAGENLVRIGLVSHVPDDAIMRRIEDVMQRDGQLDRPQIGGQVAAGLADRFQDESAKLVGEPPQPASVQGAQRTRIVDGFQQLVRGRIVFRRSGLGLAAGKIRFADGAHEGELSRKPGKLVLRERDFSAARTCAAR